MTNSVFLERVFQAYYKERKKEIPSVNLFDQREFGFIPWYKQIMIRHMGFSDSMGLRNYLIDNPPRHMYSSGSLYLYPGNQDMANKEYLGCDLIIDIDVDHFYTPCKDKHDFWYCQECDKSGKGMIQKCPKCSSLKIKKFSWFCKDCLEISKKEIIRLIDKFLVPDFNIQTNEMHIAFSGHRGYHLKVENDKIRKLSSDQRRELVDYFTGNNISFQILGFEEHSSNIYGFLNNNRDWSKKIIDKLLKMLVNNTNEGISKILENMGLSKNLVKNFLFSKQYFLDILQNNDQNLWNIKGFGMKIWKKFLTGIVHEIGIEIDEPVTIDIHRLIRYPGSLHGKTGFKVQKLSIEELSDFNPLNENKKHLNPIVFESKENMQKIEITSSNLPEFKLRDKSYGPYYKNDKIEVENHVAILLLCRDVAKLEN
ncbi:MAG: hypothetical protein KGD63_13855 [Candidatus Lokiarchaeota archaeon]|nr:hypothetical protein [Candidatus Lokiarchaeota archaeon]